MPRGTLIAGIKPFARRDSSLPFLPEPASRRRFWVTFTALFITLGTLVFGLVRYGDTQASRAVLQSLQKEEQQAVFAMSRTVQDTLQVTTSSLKYLGRLIERGLLDASATQQIESLLLDYSQTHPSFDQLRFLDVTGQEIVRVDRRVDGSVIVASDALQDKSQRDYFRGANALPAGSVFITPVEFNRERGELEYPLKPVVRLVMPVFDARNQRAGVAILNYRANELLKRLYEIGQVALGDPQVISLRGRWLMETDSGSDGGYRLNGPEDATFADRFPDEWSRLGAAQAGVVRSPAGMFSYRFLVPARLSEDSETGANANWTVQRDDSDTEGGWVVMSVVPAERLQSALAANQMLPGVSRPLIAALIFLVAWFFALQIALSRTRARAWRESAISDSLTGLANRGQFDRSLRQALHLAQRQSQPMGLVYIDVNNFKELNDSHGHASGDEVLVAIASRLQETCRKSDLAARLGGDEFAVIIWSLKGRSDADIVAAKIAETLCQPLMLRHGVYEISASIGVAVYPEDGTDPDSLLHHADGEMYAAKALSKQGGRVRAA